MKLLDYEKFVTFLDNHFGSSSNREARLVGPDREVDSGYSDIVRFFGESHVDPELVEIHYQQEEFRFSDRTIAEFAEKMAGLLRSQGRLYDGPKVACVVEEKLVSEPFRLTLQPCDYALFAGTCLSLDYPDDSFGKYETLREYYIARNTQDGLSRLPLPACVGICGLLGIRDTGDTGPRLLFMHRSSQLASLENSTGPSAAGSVDYSRTFQTLAELIRSSMQQEVEEELGLRPSELRVIPLAYAREIFRGEKPQLFCLLETDLNETVIEDRLTAVPPPREFSDYLFAAADKDICLSMDTIETLNHEARMNFYLAQEYVSTLRN